MSMDSKTNLLPEFIPLSPDNELVTVKELQLLHVSINTRLNLFTCCGSAYHAGNIGQHLRKEHAGLVVTRDTKESLRLVAESCNMQSEYPEHKASLTPIQQYAGVMVVKDLFGCKECGYTGKTSKVVNNHLQADRHSGKPCGGLQGQKLSGATRSFFRTHAPKIVTETDDTNPFLSQLDTWDWMTEHSKDDLNARMVSPFLMFTQWHVDVKPYQERIEVLCNQVSMPKEDDYGWLVAVVKGYFEYATDLMAATDELVLQRLNSHDPDKHGINNIPLHAHHQKDQTLARYVQPITRLVAALFRPAGEGYRFPIDSNLDFALGTLEDESVDAQQARAALHQVFLLLWHRLSKVTEESPRPDPTMCFLMLLCLNHTGEFTEPKNITGSITKLCRAIQLCTLVEIHRRVKADPALDQMSAMDQVQLYVTEKKLTTFNSLMSLQHYTSSLVWRTMAMPQIWWLDRVKWETMLYHGNRITLGHVQQMFQALEAEITEVWERAVLMSLGMRINYGELVENLRLVTQNYSFLDDPGNPFLRDRKWLPTKVFEDSRLLARFTLVAPGSNVRQLNTVAVRSWLADLARFEGLLMLYIDMTGGAPPRGTELVSMLVRNTSTRTRNVAALGKYIAIIRHYDKTSNIMQTDKLIPHAVCAFCSDLLIQLHALARPLAMYFAHLMEDQEMVLRYGQMLFTDIDRVFSSDDLSALMGKTSARILGWTVKIRDWRHINIAWRRKLCRQPLELVEQDTVSAVNALQSGHLPRTENRVYGLSPDALAGATEDILQLFLEASTEWQKVTKVVPGGMSMPYTQVKREHFDEHVQPDDLLGAPDPIAKLLAIEASIKSKQQELLEQVCTVDRRMSRMEDSLEKLFELLSGPSPGMQCEADEAEPLHTSTTVLHDEPGEDSALSNLLVPTPKRARTQEAWQSPERSSPSPVQAGPPPASPQDSRPQPADLLNCLKTLLGPDAGWKSRGQYFAVQNAAALQRDLVVSLPTGSGKTFVAVLPSMLETGYTIVVVPLRILMEDWERRLVHLKVPFERFEGSKGPPLQGKHNVILVSSDMVKQMAWRREMGRISTIRPIVRMVVDEVQYYFTAEDFRKEALSNPFTWRTVACQMVLLGATIPPGAWTFLQSAFCLANPLRISACSDRPELLISIFKSENPLEQTESLVQIMTDALSWTAADRYIIFVNSHAEGNEAALRLGLPMYHADSKSHPIDEQSRKQIFKDWIGGKPVGLVATSAFGAGVDYPHVRFTVHLGQPWEAVLFHQQRGRAGRDGCSAMNFIVASKDPRQPSLGSGADLRGSQAMHDLVYGQHLLEYPTACITYQTTKFLDGQGWTCAGLKRKLLCGYCKGQDDIPQSEAVYEEVQIDASAALPWIGALASTKRKLEEAFQESTDLAVRKSGTVIGNREDNLDLFKRFFIVVGGRCAYCIVAGVPSPTVHDGSNCPTMSTLERQEYQQLKYTIKYTGNKRPCYKCHIASMGRDALHPPFVKGAPCDYPNLVLPLVMGIRRHLWEQARAHFLQPWGTVTEFWDWLALANSEAGTNAMAVVEWYARNYAQ